MFSGLRSVCVTTAATLIFAALPVSSYAQISERAISGPEVEAQTLPDAPAPQITIAASETPAALNRQEPVAPAAAQQPDASQTSSSQSDASTQTTAAQTESQSDKKPDDEKSLHDKAEEQIEQEEHQRILGIMPSFNISYLGAATVSLTAKQKISLAFHSVTDPFAFVIPFFIAGDHELNHDDIGFPWGIKGLGERAGAAYLDAFDGNMLGNGILPALLHQDPRYYRLGHGSITHRMLYSLFTNVAARHDNTGKWEPNYSNIGGNIIGGAISNYYYPNSDTGIGLTISNGFVVTAEGAVGSIFEEFWPDISRKFLHKDPTHGLDAQYRAQYNAADLAKKQAKQDEKQSERQDKNSDEKQPQ